MRAFGKLLGRLLVLLALGIGALLFWPPQTRIDPPRFDTAAVPDDLDGWLATREAVFDDLTPGTAKRIHWAGKPGIRTAIALVYVHGFSASSEEIRPVPDLVAETLGANLHFTRLAGHARGFAPLGEASAEDWITDLAEAIAVGARIGDRVVIMATSTGATLTLAGLGTPELRAAIPDADRVAGLVFVSPNLRLASQFDNHILDTPFADRWVPTVLGPERSFTPANEGHATYWTTRYPMPAIFAMAQAMRTARAVPPETMTLPLLLFYSPDDRVVNPDATVALATDWGGPATLEARAMQPGMDPDGHVIAGAIRSPGLTAATAQRMSDWIGGL